MEIETLEPEVKIKPFKNGDIALYGKSAVEIVKLGRTKAEIKDEKRNHYDVKIDALKPAPQGKINAFIEKAYKPEYWNTKDQYKPESSPFPKKFSPGDKVSMIDTSEEPTMKFHNVATVKEYTSDGPHGWLVDIVMDQDRGNAIVYESNLQLIKQSENSPESAIENHQSEIIPQTPTNDDIAAEAQIAMQNKMLDSLSVDISNPKSRLYKIVNDNYYKEHPGNILGELYQASGRFGEVTKVRGTIEDSTSRIDAPLDFLSVHKIEQPLASSETDVPADALTEQGQQNIDNAIEEAKEEITAKTLSKKKKKKVITIVGDKEASVWSFEEIYKKYNPEISPDELLVFVWYKQKIGQRLSNKWYNLAGMPDFSHVEDNLKAWYEAGYVAYYKGETLPAYLYYAENVWEKKLQFGHDREALVEKYGEAAAKKQEERLQETFLMIYAKRLTITHVDPNKRLKILPISKFAKKFMITSLNDEKPFTALAETSEKNKGKIDFLRQDVGRSYDKKEVEAFSLLQAFQFWLMNYKSNYEFKKNVSAYEIISVYINMRPKPKDMEETQWQRVKNDCKMEAERLFDQFLLDWLKKDDITALENQWNTQFNSYVPINFNKVPVAFTVAKEYRNELVDIRPEKREAVANAFSEGVLCLAYDVGVGKTWSAIFTIAQFIEAGYCSRPFLSVPNQTYKQWISEIKGLLPHVKINDLYNMGNDYLDELRGPDMKVQKVAEGSLSMMTYEGMERIGFNDTTSNDMLMLMYDILAQKDTGKEKSAKAQAKSTEALFGRLEMLIGRGLQGTMINIEDLGFDFACYDEAHKMKKVFVDVKGESEAEGERAKVRYEIKSQGKPSSIALKGFMLSQYILRNNHERNILTLTATPFTNSPLEIYSTLAFLAYDKLKDQGLSNLQEFFNTYINTSTELVINAKLRPERRQVVLGFNNLKSLQQTIRRFINYKTGESVNVQRPNKYVLPLEAKIIDGVEIKLPVEEQISTRLPLSPLQKSLMLQIREYAEGKLKFEMMCADSDMSSHETDTRTETDEDVSVDGTVGAELDESAMDDDEEKAVRILRAMSFARNLALSPFLFSKSCTGGSSGCATDFKEYIMTSPKLSYVMDCIKTVKQHHEKNNTPVSGQVIYMDRGVDCFGLIKEYLVKVIGFKDHEVGIIKSAMPGGKDAKENIKNKFLGLRYEETTGEFVDIPDAERIKVIIGSGTIKEGINLQRHSTVLYNCFLDWSPTDNKQLEGRIWRQGNFYNNVRIVLPLMEDSMDIFILQKLYEKTARIGEIWDTSMDTNTFDLTEFNPSELKRELISDATILAELELQEKEERLQDEVIAMNNEIGRIKTIQEAEKTYEGSLEDFEELVNTYRPAKELGEKRAHSTMVSLWNDILKNQTDAEGKKMLSYWESRTPSERQKYIDAGFEISDQEQVHAPFWISEFLVSKRVLDKAVKEYLEPRKIKLSQLPTYITHLEKKIEEINAVKKDTTGEEAIKVLARQIEEERAARKIIPVTVSQRVKEFTSLNYLLDDRKVKKVKAEIEPEFCMPLDANGVRRTDAEAIRIIENCIQKSPTTKALFAKDGVYTEERKKLHKQIIEKFTTDLACIKKDKPIAVFTGGPSGAGKTTFLKKYASYLLDPRIFHINADDVRELLPEYKGWNSAVTHDETKDIVREMISGIGKGCHYDITYDGTMNTSRNYFPLINQVKQLGYKTFIIYIYVPKEVSIQRVTERFKKTGRYVPLAYIDELYQNGLSALNQLKPVVDGYMVVDGVTGEVLEKGGESIPKDRDYSKISDVKNFVTEADAEKKKKIKIATAKAAAQKQRIRILSMK